MINYLDDIGEDKDRFIEWTEMDEQAYRELQQLRQLDAEMNNFYQDDELALWYKNNADKLIEEVDPAPKSFNKALADRKNDGKPKYSLLDLQCLEPCVRALEYGLQKYNKRNGWKKGFPVSELLDSLIRHISQLLAGEEKDKESGLSHICHIQANALFLGNIKNNIDDLKENK